MNIFEKLSLSREVTIKDGEIVLDQQRVIWFPVDLIALYSFKCNSNVERAKNLYNAMKTGMSDFSKPLGKTYGLSYRDFLDRWIKYNAFGGWGIVEYKVIETDSTKGFLTYKNLSTHLYLKNNGHEGFWDPLLEGVIAGALGDTFRKDIDVVETECIGSGSNTCVFHWDSKENLKEKFPDAVAKRGLA